DLLVPLLEEGYQRTLVLNGHGGNSDTLRLALRRLQPRYRDRLLTGASYWELAEKELAALAEGPRKTMGHACELETSMVLAVRPDLVRREEIRDDPRAEDTALRGLYVATDMKQSTDHGAAGYPEWARADKGRAFLAAAIAPTAEAVQALLRRPLRTPYPPPGPAHGRPFSPPRPGQPPGPRSQLDADPAPVRKGDDDAVQPRDAGHEVVEGTDRKDPGVRRLLIQKVAEGE